MARKPPVMSAALPAREIIKPPRLETRKSKPRASAVRGGCAPGLHQRAEKRCGYRVTFHSFRIPLHARDPVFMLLLLDCVDHPVGSDRVGDRTLDRTPSRCVMR